MLMSIIVNFFLLLSLHNFFVGILNMTSFSDIILSSLYMTVYVQSCVCNFFLDALMFK